MPRAAASLMAKTSGLGCVILTPDAGESGPDLFLEACDQLAISGDQRLFGFDLGDDGLLRSERGDRDLNRLNVDKMKVRDRA